MVKRKRIKRAIIWTTLIRYDILAREKRKAIHRKVDRICKKYKRYTKNLVRVHDKISELNYGNKNLCRQTRLSEELSYTNEVSYIVNLGLTIFPRAILKIERINNGVYFTISKNFLTNIVEILKNSSLFGGTLSDITCIDYLGVKSKRFVLIYMFVFIEISEERRRKVYTPSRRRIFLKVELDDLETVPSITSQFKSANGLEREIGDMFGVYFENHPDLRRILTDYGFDGFPLRKDFPLTGYLEIVYDDKLKKLIYRKVELSQEYRDFDFQSGGENRK